MPKPDIGIQYAANFPDEAIREFENDLQHDSLDVRAKAIQGPQVFASLDLIIPPLVIAYVCKPYFDAMFKELGKEHFEFLKSKMTKLTKKTMSTPKVEPKLVRSGGEVDDDSPYSRTFGLVAEVTDDIRFRLLLPKHSEENDYNELVPKFFNFAAEYHGFPANSEAFKIIEQSGEENGELLVTINQETGEFEWVDPMPAKIRAAYNAGKSGASAF
jgi:hypothetical protein